MAYDMRGIMIADNDLVTYPGRNGSRQWINVARVKYTHQDGRSIRVVPFMSNGEKINDQGRDYTITYPDHKVYVVHLPKLDENEPQGVAVSVPGYAGDPPS